MTQIPELPSRLEERICSDTGRPLKTDAPFVLYWMRTAVRGHENPALDTALHLANALSIPVLVYHAVSERYPFASDRHHAFILQGARDVSAELRERGIAYALHVEREGHRGPHLRTLAERAACVVTEEMPVPPLKGWTKALADACPQAVMTVDTAHVVPLPLGTDRPDRAFKFRDKTARVRDERLMLPWEDLQPTVAAPEPSSLDLPFEPVDAEQMVIGDLLAECKIDHAVAPVADTPGGTKAGYERWAQFKKRIRHYAGTRNNPLKHGVSRMSAYLHYGQVSPLRVAREAAQLGGKGPEKYLDELLVWRELAGHWAFRQADVHDQKVIPPFARETLRQHESDQREMLPSWETLARGQTGDVLWDACQRSLLRHGELHNNVRMTWGKAIPAWTPNLDAAMRLLVDLNHRYALDGRDPSSYGGLWWCLGLFDRAFEPAEPVLGTVRGRPTSVHAERMNVDRYLEHVSRDIADSVPRVAVVGAGLAGSICARTLIDHGLDVQVFDKSRGPGGRMSTRRVEFGSDTLRFDHGAQYFTARDPRFVRPVRSWIADGIAARWDGRIATLKQGVVGEDPNPGERFVGTPGMNEVVRHVQRDLGVRFETRIQKLEQNGDGWTLSDEGGATHGPFDEVVLAIPADQAKVLLEPLAGRVDAGLIEAVNGVAIAPGISVLLAFDRSLDLAFDGAFVEDSPLSWIARDSSKPGRAVDGVETWMLHASPEWSAEHLEQEPETWRDQLVEAFRQAAGLSELPEPVHIDSHRWRYALPTQVTSSASLHDPASGLGCVGDWCGGPRVEGAFLSGQDLAGRILRQCTLKRPAVEAR